MFDEHLYILDAKGKPIPCRDMLRWARWMAENFKQRQVALDELADGHVVSTVFLGFDHNHRGFGPPLLYETMTFNDYGDIFCERYATKEEALVGHDHALVEVALMLQTR